MLFTTPLLYGICMGLIDVLILGFLKMRSIGAISTNWIFGLSFLIYGLQPLIFYRALKVTTLTSMNLIWDLSSDIMVTLIGLYMFKESLNTKERIGLGLGLIALFLLK